MSEREVGVVCGWEVGVVLRCSFPVLYLRLTAVFSLQLVSWTFEISNLCADRFAEVFDFEHCVRSFSEGSGKTG